MSSEGPALLLSWNVAGWTSTHLLVKSHYTSLGNYWRRFGNPAIVCLQETKVQAKSLSTEAQAKDLGAILGGYRSFWAFNRDKDPKKSYLQGVATWVRDDVPVIGATQQVLRIPELDGQGRCLLTDHGSFIILNVYAQHIGTAVGEDELRAKHCFLSALRERMEEMIVRGKRVVLCGDLNLTYRLLDQKLGRRLLWIDSSGCLATLQSQQRLQHLQESGDDSTAAEESDQARLASVKNPTRGSALFGEWASQWVSIKQVSERSGLPEDALAESGECVHIREGSCVQWLRQLVAPGGGSPAAWADVFAEVHPLTEDRFTAWGQHANLRYCNSGTRIDYIICDRATFEECVVKSPSSKLPGSKMNGAGQHSDTRDAEEVVATSARAAVNAATHFGAWHAAPVTGIARGEGMAWQKDNMLLNNSQFPEEPYTGLFYTPPAYSDHIGVSALFTNHLLEGPACKKVGEASVVPEGETRQCQPWLAQPSLSCFFASQGPRSCSVAMSAALDAPLSSAPSTGKHQADTEVTPARDLAPKQPTGAFPTPTRGSTSSCSSGTVKRATKKRRC